MKEFVEVDLGNLSFKEIKENVTPIIITDESKNSYEKLSEKLLSDKRKNVISLGERIKKEIKKHDEELKRVKAMYDFDKSFGYEIVAGVDEVGRGPLAGPIVSAAVVLKLNAEDKELLLGVKDSKALSEEKREELDKLIREKAISYSIAECSHKDIDSKGIAFCNNDIFQRAINGLNVKPEIVLSDGYRVKGLNIKNEAVIKGDAKSITIAAASIIAKVYRDNLMKKYAEEYPDYGFEKNVGYGSKNHIDALLEKGPCEIHRISFLSNILSK